jgi:hypothetical protein
MSSKLFSHGEPISLGATFRMLSSEPAHPMPVPKLAPVTEKAKPRAAKKPAKKPATAKKAKEPAQRRVSFLVKTSKKAAAPDKAKEEKKEHVEDAADKKEREAREADVKADIAAVLELTEKPKHESKAEAAEAPQ